MNDQQDSQEQDGCGHTEAEHREMFGDQYAGISGDGTGVGFGIETVSAEDDRTKEFISSVNLANLAFAFAGQEQHWPQFLEFIRKNGQDVLKFEEPVFTPRVLGTAAEILVKQVRAFASASAFAHHLGAVSPGDLRRMLENAASPRSFLREKGTD